MSKQLEVGTPLNVVLKDRINSGCTIIQGRHHSRPLQRILDGSPGCKPFFIDLQDRKEVIEYRKEDQVITVETGILLSELSLVLGQNQQFLPCFAARDLSLLEVVNSGETGYFEHSYGIRSLVLGLEVLLSTGETIKTGGKVVKNVTGYDLTKLFLGGRGTLGVPTRAHLRVFAQPEQNELFLVSGVKFESLLYLANNLIKTGLSFSGLELVANSELNNAADFLLVSVGEHASVILELVPLIEDLCQKANATITKLDRNEHGDTILSLEDEFDLDQDVLTTSVSRSQCRRIHAALAGENKLKLHFRPGTGRLRMKFGSNKEMVNATSILRRTLKEGESDIDIVTSDENFEFLTARLSGVDEELESIKQAIKEKFDRSKRMNPFARL